MTREWVMYSIGKCWNVDLINVAMGRKNVEHVGLRWRENKDKKHPLKTILKHAIKLNLTYLAAVLENNI